jgi:hypothetical protein
MKKPFVCICDFTIVVTPKQWMNRIKSGNQRIRKEAIDKYVYEIKLKDYPITLIPDSKTFPTEKTRERVLKGIWTYTKQKKKYDSVLLEIRNIEIKHKSPVNYRFSYEKD